MKGLSAILALCLIGLSHGFGFMRTPADTSYQPIKRWNFYHPSFFSPPTNTLYSRALPQGWAEDWQKLSEVFSPAPTSKLDVKWENSRLISPGDTIPVTVMGEKPARLRWDSERGALYTVMLLDAGISRLLPKMYVHWMVTNIPANNIQNGKEVMEYVTPFSLEFTESGEFITHAVKSSHPLILAVFKQEAGKIIVEEAQKGCGKDIVEPRIVDYKEIETKYSLSLVAGNYLYMPYSGQATHAMICRLSKCLGEQWPFPIPGINDLEECQPRQDIIDVTIRAPKKGFEEQYNKYASQFSPDSITNLLKETTSPRLSTGKGKEYRAIELDFNPEKLPETFDGVVDSVFLNYPNKEAAEKVFFEFLTPQQTLFPSPDKTPIFQRLGPLFETIYFPPIAIVLSTPDDQDFDPENIAEGPGWVFDLLVTKVKEGQEEAFQEARRKVKARMLNMKTVENFLTFTVNRDILQDERNALKDDTERIELTIASHKSKEKRAEAFAEISQTPEFQEWFPTFECIVCPLLRDFTEQDYLPPYQV
jgi:hypothetical protein